jgi:ActR/RegA family two-component response regulator
VEPVTKRLLLIDDEETILFALDRYFSRNGYKVDCARELEEAEALAGCCCYDLVIADLSLTENGSTEGLEILRYIRQTCPTARFILLTAHATALVEHEAMRRGVDAFLHKPRPLADIARIAATLMGESRA